MNDWGDNSRRLRVLAHSWVGIPWLENGWTRIATGWMSRLSSREDVEMKEEHGLPGLALNNHAVCFWWGRQALPIPLQELWWRTQALIWPSPAEEMGPSPPYPGALTVDFGGEVRALEPGG